RPIPRLAPVTTSTISTNRAVLLVLRVLLERVRAQELPRLPVDVVGAAVIVVRVARHFRQLDAKAALVEERARVADEAQRHARVVRPDPHRDRYLAPRQIDVGVVALAQAAGMDRHRRKIFGLEEPQTQALPGASRVAEEVHPM